LREAGEDPAESSTGRRSDADRHEHALGRGHARAVRADARAGGLGAAGSGGRLIHIASFTADGLRVTDVRESAADFNRFAENRLMPVVQEIGIAGQPDVTISEIQAVWNPGVAQAAGARV
jgi:hypothetical protein